MSWYSTVPRLPVIDLSLYEVGDPWRDHVAAQLDWAASEFGSFYVIGHGVDSALTESVVESGRSFFRMIEARTGRTEAGTNGAGGRLLIEGDPSHSSLLSDVPEFRHSAAEYVQGLTGLAHKVMGLLGRALRLGPSYFADQITGRPNRELHIIDTSMEDAGGFSGESFRNGGLLSMAYQSGNSGLQIEHETGWIQVPYVRGSFVVTIGERLERFTHGRYRAAVQRQLPGTRAGGIIMPFIFKLTGDPRCESAVPRNRVLSTARIVPTVASQSTRLSAAV